MMTLVTVGAVPPHTCSLPNPNLNDSNFAAADDDDYYYNQTAAAPSLLPRVLDACHYLDVDNATKECTSWIYDTSYVKSSRGIEWNAVCSKRWMFAVAQSAYMFGVFFGAVTLGSMADRYGRKIIFYISAVAQLVLGVSVAFIPEFYTLVLVRFVYGIFGSAGAYITGFVLTMELVGASKRTICGMIFQLNFAIGFMLVAFWTVLVSDHTTLQVIYGLHSALLIGHWWLMDESPRWLWTQGRHREALVILQRALRINGCRDKLDIESYLRDIGAATDDDDNNKESATTTTTAYNATDLLKTRNLRKKTLNICLNWFANAIVYYGLSLSAAQSSSSSSGNPFFMMFMMGLVEVPAYVLTSLILDKTGRRSLTSTYMLIGGLCCIIATAVPNETIVMLLVLFGKASIAGSFAIVYNYTAELFPTVLRNTALGVGSMCARLSGALTPLIMLLDSLNVKVPAIIFGLVALVSGFLVLYLPETMNKPIPETLEDGENFGKHDTCFTSCLRRSKSAHQDPDEVALKAPTTAPRVNGHSDREDANA